MGARTFNIDSAGQTHLVTIEEGARGVAVVIVDGVSTGKSLSSEETERIVPVGGTLYVVRRAKPDGFEIEPYQRPGAPSQPVNPAIYATAKSGAMPLRAAPDHGSRRFYLAAWGAVALTIVTLLWVAMGPGYERQAAARVEQMLEEMSAGTGAEAQFAVGLWARNVPKLTDLQELSWASDNFDKWRLSRDLYRTFSNWEVVDSVEVEGAPVPTAIVRVRIEGRELKMLVPERKPISWTD